MNSFCYKEDIKRFTLDLVGPNTKNFVSHLFIFLLIYGSIWWTAYHSCWQLMQTVFELNRSVTSFSLRETLEYKSK